MADKPLDPDFPDADASDPSETIVEDHIQRVRLRRAPKFSVFVIAGAVLGLLTALILTYAYDGTVNQSPNTGMVYSQGQVFGFLALIGVAVGIAVFATIAIILDRRSSRHSREVMVDRETVHRLPEA
jgi:hypothetical protein